MNRLQAGLLGMALAGAPACNQDGSYEEGFEDGLEQDQGGGDNGADTEDPTEQDSHVDVCRDILAQAEEALEEGYVANVTVDADPNELSSGYEDGTVWMRDAFDTDDGNDQTHVPCTSLRIDGAWEVAGEADWARQGSDLDVVVDFEEEDFDRSSMVKLNWIVLENSGPRFATYMNGNEDTLYTVDHDATEPIGY